MSTDFLESCDWLFAASSCPKCGADSCGGRPCERCASALERSHVEARVREERANRVAAFAASVPENYRLWATTPTEELAVRLTVNRPQVQAADREAVLGVSHDVPMIVLGGHAGAGKTTLAVARGRALVEAGVTVRFVSALEIGGEARDTRLGQGREIFESAKRAPVLIVDDLGKDLKLGPVSSGALIELICARHDHARPTIVTTGLKTLEIKSGYDDDGMLRRLTEKGRASLLWIGPRVGARSE